MNYEAINIFTREKEMGKEKRTVAAEPKLPSVAIEILRSFF